MQSQSLQADAAKLETKRKEIICDEEAASSNGGGSSSSSSSSGRSRGDGGGSSSAFKHMKLKIHLASSTDDSEEGKQEPDSKSGTDDSDKVQTTGDVSDNSDDSEVSNPSQLLNRILNEFGVSFVRDNSNCKLATCGLKLCSQQLLPPLDDSDGQQSAEAAEAAAAAAAASADCDNPDGSLYYTKKFHEKFSSVNRKRKLEAPGLSLNNFVRFYSGGEHAEAVEELGDALVETMSSASTLNDDAASLKDAPATSEAEASGGTSSAAAAAAAAAASGEPCAVCEDRATGLHYGVMTCEGCKGFFKRTVQNRRIYECGFGQDCDVQLQRRNNCQFCRFRKCLETGMVVEAVRENHMPGGRNSKAVYGKLFTPTTKQSRPETSTESGRHQPAGKSPDESQSQSRQQQLQPQSLHPPRPTAHASRSGKASRQPSSKRQAAPVGPKFPPASSYPYGPPMLPQQPPPPPSLPPQQQAALFTSGITRAPLPPGRDAAYSMMGPAMTRPPRLPSTLGLPDPAFLAAATVSHRYFQGQPPPPPPPPLIGYSSASSISPGPPGAARLHQAALPPPPLRRPAPLPTGASYYQPMQQQQPPPQFPASMLNGGGIPSYSGYPPHQHFQQQQQQQHYAAHSPPQSDSADPSQALRLLSSGLTHPLPISLDLVREAVDKADSLASCLTELEKVCLMCIFRWSCEADAGPGGGGGASFANWKHILLLSATRHFLVSSQTLRQAGTTSMSHLAYELGSRIKRFAADRQVDLSDRDGRMNSLLAEMAEFCSVILDVVLNSRKDVISDFIFLLSSHTEEQVVARLENQPRLLPALRAFRATAAALEKARPDQQALLIGILVLPLPPASPAASGGVSTASPPSSGAAGTGVRGNSPAPAAASRGSPSNIGGGGGSVA